jgi:rhamnosyltransferase
MKPAAVVVWYNPQEMGEGVAVENIAGYADLCEPIIIVDNSAANNFSLAKKISHAVYMPNMENLGIGCALNQGCKAACELGSEWVMTMDQDSSWDVEQLTGYIQNAESLHKTIPDVASFGPSSHCWDFLVYRLRYVNLRRFAKSC